jgi:hypothetical protein
VPRLVLSKEKLFIRYWLYQQDHGKKNLCLETLSKTCKANGEIYLSNPAAIYLVIDEMSMLGQKSLYWIDQRTKQITGKMKEPFGGLSVILCGDFGQLPPVKDRALFRTSNRLFKSQIHIAAEALFMLFDNVLILTKQKRVNGPSQEDQLFRDALIRLHEGASTVRTRTSSSYKRDFQRNYLLLKSPNLMMLCIYFSKKKIVLTTTPKNFTN